MRSNPSLNAEPGCIKVVDTLRAVASLIETCKLNGVDPQRYLTGLLTRLVNGWPQARIDALMPWNGAADTDGWTSSP